MTVLRARVRLLVVGTVAAAPLVLTVACVPPPDDPPPTTAPGCALSTASRADAAAATAWPPPALSGPAVATAADAAAADALAGRSAATDGTSTTGPDLVTIVAVDGSDRPVFVDVPAPEAAMAAIGVAATMRVLAVEASRQVVGAEAPAGSTAVTAGSADPLVGQQWPHASYRFADLWACGRGAGVEVAVVDTGVDASHADFDGRVTPGVAFLGGRGPELGGGDDDPHGHGTHVAGIIGAGDNGMGIVGVAPSVTIVPVRVLQADFSGSSTDIANGITWAADQGVDVINASFGSDVESAAVGTAVAYALSRDVTVVAAGGNGGPGGPIRYPAAFEGVLGISAVDESATIAPYSTSGPHIDLAGPGSDVLSTFPGGTWGRDSGSSMATAHVSGVAAIIDGARGGVGPEDMAARLTATATDEGPAGWDEAYGWGRLDPLDALLAP